MIRLLTFLFAFSTTSSFAQDHEDYTALLKNPNYLKCSLVTLDHDSIPALMENYREVYKRYGDKGGKIDIILSTEGSTTLKAEEFRGYELTLRNKKTQRYFSIDGLILQVKYAGEMIKLFEREEFVLKGPKNAFMVSPNVRRKYYVRKKYEAYLTDVEDIADNEVLAQYFEECPALSKKIGQPKSKARDIVSLVQRYDKCLTGE